MRDATRTEALERDRAMWRTYARTGHLLNILVLLIDTAYVVATWTTGAHRPLLLAINLGALIGLAAALLMLLTGRIAGISGIFGGLLTPNASDRGWRIAFIAGLIAAIDA